MNSWHASMRILFTNFRNCDNHRTLEEHINIVMNGKPNTTMAAFRGQLDDADIPAIITYERNTLGNSMDDLVQPSEINSLR